MGIKGEIMDKEKELAKFEYSARIMRNKIPKTIIIPKGTKLSSVPTRIHFVEDVYELVIGIGKDHVAYLYLDQDALKALEEEEPQTTIL